MPDARRFSTGCVASPHYLASAAGLAVLTDGGNALDAAVATNLTLGVVMPYACGYGGDLFAIVWDGEQVHAYNGSGRAPAAATADAVRGAVGGTAMPPFGPHTITVPGAVEAWFALLDRFGTRSFAELSATAERYAREGFVLTRGGAATILASRDRYPDSREWHAAYAHAEPHRRFAQPSLARTIATLAASGPDAYYRGDIAAAVAAHVQSVGGLLAASDLAEHHGDWVTTLTSTYRGVEVHELPPNSQGVTALEALNIAEEVGAHDVPAGPRREHLHLEAMKLALADRGAAVTDPESMTVDPALLASKAWAKERAALIDPERASFPASGRAAAGGTIYLCAADDRGMGVSLIQSNYIGFGSGVHVPEWGINLQNRGSYFSLDDDHVNVIAPGKRTMHTLMPALAFRDGRPWLVFGTMGADGQAQTQLQLLTKLVDDGADLQAALDAPRWFVSPAGFGVTMEARFATETVDDLRARGHDVTVTRPLDTVMGHANAILISNDGFVAASDPRSEGAALGW
jgi:gamma-glutamyltranspeptidase/glutathione hydrolase